jgi:hypothetical protein
LKLTRTARARLIGEDLRTADDKPREFAPLDPDGNRFRVFYDIGTGG